MPECFVRVLLSCRLYSSTQKKIAEPIIGNLAWTKRLQHGRHSALWHNCKGKIKHELKGERCNQGKACRRVLGIRGMILCNASPISRRLSLPNDITIIPLELIKSNRDSVRKAREAYLIGFCSYHVHSRPWAAIRFEGSCLQSLGDVRAQAHHMRWK